MRVLGIDHGSRRVGLALSDELGMIAQPAGYLEAEPASGVFEAVVRLVQDKAVGRIIVGMPRNMDGSYGPAAEGVRQFLEVLRGRVSVPVVAWDERLTTAQAQRVLIQGGVRRSERKEKVDAAAAAILLQSYLDAHPV